MGSTRKGVKGSPGHSHVLRNSGKIFQAKENTVAIFSSNILCPLLHQNTINVYPAPKSLTFLLPLSIA